MPVKKASKKTASKKAAPKKSAKKKAVSKKPAKKAAAKKAAPKKSSAKKTVSKKAATKKTPSKKSVAKKASPKKASPKKSAKKKAAPKKKGRTLASSPELSEVSCQLALLALAQEDSPLGVRQREQLRRALAIAGDALGWTNMMSGNGGSVAALRGDVMEMAESGAKFLGRDLAEQLVGKKAEIAQLNKIIEWVRELAEDPKTVYPVDVTFSHTVRDAYQELITKTETRVVNDGDEARAAAASIERSMTSWTKLADHMIIDLKRRQRQLETVGRSLPDFVQSSNQLLGEVVANLA